jgi:hypothetical protein
MSDDPKEVARSPASGGVPGLLQRLAKYCHGALVTADERAKSYLRENGVTAESVWRDYRLGVGDGKILEGFSLDEQTELAKLKLITWNNRCVVSDTGIIIPTIDPQEPQKTVGLIKLNYAQNQHHFITPPAGLACQSALPASGEITIADAPLLALRLAQMGAKNVVLAETSEVLPPLRDWLAQRKVTLVSCKKCNLAALQAAIGPLAEKASGILVAGELERNGAALAALGIDPAVVKKTETPLAPSQRHVVDLVRYAQARLAAGEGLELVREHGADNSEFISVFQIGFLPVNFRAALDSETRKVWQNRIDANALVVPALDAQGLPVDLMNIRALACGDNRATVFDQPRGLVGAKVASAYPSIAVTDSFRALTKLFQKGQRNVLVLRGAEDAKNNAKRLHGCGVRSATVVCSRHADEISSALDAVGIQTERRKFPKATYTPLAPNTTPATAAVESPTATPAIFAPAETPPSNLLETAPACDLSYPDKPVLVGHDTKMMRAKFTAGDASYEIETALDCGAKLEVRVERQQLVHLDRFDVSKAAQRRRYAESAALRVKMPFEVVDKHLICLLDAARELQQELLNPGSTAKTVHAATMTDAERAEALELLRQPDLLDRITTDLEDLGWAGEERLKRLLYLVAISRKLDKPLSGTVRAPTCAGKSFAIENIAALAPPEDTIHLSHLTESSLRHAEGLRNKLLVIDEADALTSDVMTTLRVLQSRGALTHYSSAGRDAVTGLQVTRFGEARGPVAVLTTTTREMDCEFLSRCYDLTVDDSPKQTERILEAQRRLKQLGAEGRREQIIARHRNFQRLLESRQVLIPFAEHIQFPFSSIKHRREHARFLNLVEASALLHQYQRLKHRDKDGEEFVIADLRDYEIAAALAAESIARAGGELSSHGRDVLALVVEAKLASFTMEDLTKQRSDWTRHKLRAGLDELLRLEAVTSPRGGRGKLRMYHLQAGAAAMLSAPVVRLLQGEQLAKLAKVGENGLTNFTPSVATA